MENFTFCAVNQLHEGALRIVYKDKKTTYDELLQKDNSVKVHYRNLQFPSTEILK